MNKKWPTPFVKLSFRLLILSVAIDGMTSVAKADFASCKQDLERQALSAGISKNVAESALAGANADPKVLELENYQPEFKIPIWDYLAVAVDDERVADGKNAISRNLRTLEAAEERFGVSRYVLAAIWGVESNFGREMGDRPLISSLTTLSCMSSKRPRYFRGELMSALKIADRGDIKSENLTGSWAGAFGQTQFMPSTFLKLAVDLDGSGRDIIRNSAAALGSTANYLKKAGWITGEPWLFEVRLPSNYDGPSGRGKRHPVSFWESRGIRRVDGRSMGDFTASLLLPAGQAGPAFLTTRNFDAIYSYNAAESYALAVAMLAQRLEGGPGVVTPWPTDDPGLSRAQRRRLQELLIKRGYDVGPPDGAVGAKTRAAIEDVQRKAGMAADGRPSTKVLESMEQ